MIDDRRVEHHHLPEVDRDRFGHAALLRFDARVRGRRVDEHDDRPAEFLGEAHGAERLAVALRAGVAEIPEDLFLGVPALDVSHEQHGLPLVVGEARHDRVVVGEPAVAVELDEPGEQAFDEVLESWALRVPRHQHALPRGEGPVEIAAQQFDAALERGDLAIARVGAR